MVRELFEIEFGIHPIYFLPLMMLSFVLIVGVFIVKECKTKGYPVKPYKIIGIIISAVMLQWQLIFTFPVVQDLRVLNAYREGNYEVVEGYVENFKASVNDKGNEEFEINGVAFSYTGNGMSMSYSASEENGGVISGNGQKLRIKYVRAFLSNHIVYISEIIPENE